MKSKEKQAQIVFILQFEKKKENVKTAKEFT